MADRISELEAENARLRTELAKALELELDTEESSKATLFMLEDLSRVQNNLVRAKSEWVGTFDAITDPIFIHAKEFRIVRANRAYQEAAGMPFAEIIGRPYYEVFPKMDGPFKMCLMAIEEMQEKEEVFLPSLDKIYIVSFYPVKNKDGEYLYSAHIMKDMTEERKAAEALIKSEKKYRDLVNNAAVGVYKSNLRGDILFMNQALANMFEFESPAEVISAGAFSRYKNPEDREKLRDVLLKDGMVDNFEADMVTKTGKLKHLLFNATLEGDVLSGMVLDITERKNLDELLRGYSVSLEEEVKSRTAQLEETNLKLEDLNKELEAFTYSASHDLKAPLRAIDGFSKVLLEDYSERLEENGRNYLKRVRTASQRMGVLIDELLKLSRLSRAEMRRQAIDLSRLVNEIAKELMEAEPEREVQFVIAEGLKADADAYLIRIALENLLRNAWKFTSKQPEARIEFGAKQKVEAGDQGQSKTVYFVRDNGAGFDTAYADKLFKPFQRLHSSDEFPGTGIGLTIVDRIISRHGGDVWAEGKVGKGAAFYFTL